VKPTEEDRLKLFDNMRQSKSAYEWFYDSVLSCVVGKQYWNKHCHEADGCSMANNGDEALALLLLDNCWELWKHRAENINKRREEGLPENDSETETEEDEATGDNSSITIGRGVRAQGEKTNDAVQGGGDVMGEPGDASSGDDLPPAIPQKRRRKQKNRRGSTKPGEGRDYGTKYTTAKGGTKMLGGWTVEGINKFTAFRNSVAKDRKERGGVFDRWYRARKLRERRGKVVRVKGEAVGAGYAYPANDWSDEEDAIGVVEERVSNGEEGCGETDAAAAQGILNLANS
jgi:hypothetical protein